jgi:hypothetical protein
MYIKQKKHDKKEVEKKQRTKKFDRIVDNLFVDRIYSSISLERRLFSRDEGQGRENVMIRLWSFDQQWVSNSRAQRIIE